MTYKLVRKYEPVLCFSKDGQGNPESFFPVAAMHYVHACGLRRRSEAWAHPPGETLLKHLDRLVKPGNCYLAYAAGDVQDSDVVVELLDQGLEIARAPDPAVSYGVGPEEAPVGGMVVPRLLVSREKIQHLEEAFAAWGGVERRPLATDELAAMLDQVEQPLATKEVEAAFEFSLAPGSPEGIPDAGAVAFDAEIAAAHLEWVVPRAFANLPEEIHERALQKYARYRDWQAHPPVYHYHVCQDGPYRVLQYWFLYAYNDWAVHGGYNDHEGDWEVVFVFLDGQDQPQRVAYSRHIRIPWLYEPSTARWSEVERVEGTHPVVYVGCGSHASYLEQGKHRILWRIDYAEGNDVSIGPGTDQPWGRPIRLGNKRWNVRFSGKWGALVKSSLGRVFPGTEGPTGPAQKGDKWRHPARWAGFL
jgi:hypothetical protein